MHSCHIVMRVTLEVHRRVAATGRLVPSNVVSQFSAMTRIRSSLLAGAIAGLGAGLLFAAAHAIVIVPIWSRMIGGLLFGIAAGTACGWAYAELKAPDASRSRLRDGATFGVLLWLAVVPVTLTNALLRHTGFAGAHKMSTDTVAVVLALAGGAALGWILSRRWRGALAAAAALLMITMAMGGPVPVGRSVRAVEILFAVLAAAVFGGIVLAYLEPMLRGRTGSGDGGGRTPNAS
jgi:hypothetical protein